eukprot:98301-Rhodomonas_salina.3
MLPITLSQPPGLVISIYLHTIYGIATWKATSFAADAKRLFTPPVIAHHVSVPDISHNGSNSQNNISAPDISHNSRNIQNEATKQRARGHRMAGSEQTASGPAQTSRPRRALLRSPAPRHRLRVRLCASVSRR